MQVQNLLNFVNKTFHFFYFNSIVLGRSIISYKGLLIENLNFFQLQNTVQLIAKVLKMKRLHLHCISYRYSVFINVQIY